MIRRHKPVAVRYRGYSFSITDWGSRMARFGVSEINHPSLGLCSLVREDGWLSRTRGGALKGALRSIDEHCEREAASADTGGAA